MAEPVGVLGEIVAAKRAELAARFAAVSLDSLRAGAKLTNRSLSAALSQPGARFILEIKRASPSQGMIRRSADPAAISRAYSGVADALSVLSDSAYFGGSLADLQTARPAFDGPILAKDFFVDLRQVAEARIAGADAILVMLSFLGDEEARAMIAEAERFGMDALVEVHDEGQMRRALALGAPLIGINNRDLRDLSVDLATTERLAPRARDAILVSESGIGTRGDVERLAPKVDAFLVGSSLMRAPDPALAARALVFGRVKLCGLASEADVRAAQPAAFAGFVFVPGTPRHVTAEQAAPLAGIARKSGVVPVGVFRDAPLRVVADIASLLNLHAVQLHGSEDLEYARALRRELPGACELWTAMGVRQGSLSARGGDRILFDNGFGATGRTFDWALICGHPDLPRAIIAGGIGTDNARAAQRLGGYAIDVGSAVDQRPGTKSPAKIAALFDGLRPQCRHELRACA
jgi:indole-3-glycerol phosphate synthase/phosphoribosylanthranilate isomerase